MTVLQLREPSYTTAHHTAPGYVIVTRWPVSFIDIIRNNIVEQQKSTGREESSFCTGLSSWLHLFT